MDIAISEGAAVFWRWYQPVFKSGEIEIGNLYGTSFLGVIVILPSLAYSLWKKAWGKALTLFVVICIPMFSGGRITPPTFEDLRFIFLSMLKILN